MEGYYVYLPSVFIYNGFKKEAVRDSNYLRTYPGTSKIYTKYTCGVALMELPFFLAAHLLSKPLGYKNNGHSNIYCYALMIAGIFYMLAGMLFLWKMLTQFYNSRVAAISLFALLAGTNLFYYTFFQPAMSHVYSFFLFAVVLYLSHKLFSTANHEKLLSVSSLLLFGFVCGMVVLVRPTNIIVLLYPFYLWYKNINSKQTFFIAHIWKLPATALFFFIPFIPQLIYWHYISGSWVLWSYGDEGFTYWKEPKLWRVLFDAWNGWILYSPVVLLPIFQLIKERKNNRHYERASGYILLLATWIFASWWAWWFGGAFGHRSYVEFLALLAIPLAGFLTDAAKSKWLFVIVNFTLAILIYYSLALTFAYTPPWDGANWTYTSFLNILKKIFFL